MPPLLSRKKDTLTPNQLLLGVVRLASSLGLAQGSCGLAAATARQTLELELALNPLKDLLSSTIRYNVHETLAALEASPAARAALVQLFSSALRLLSPDDAKPEVGKAETSRHNESKGNRDNTSATCTFSSSPSSAALDGTPAGRPTGPSPQRLLGILTAIAQVLSRYLGAAIKKPPDVVSGLEVSCVSASSATFLALLRCDALQGLSRLLAVEWNRSAGAKLLTDTHEDALMELLFRMSMCACAVLRRPEDSESPLCRVLLDALAGSQLVDHWAAHVLQGTARTTATEGKARGGHGKASQQYTRELLSAVELLSVRLKLYIAAPVPSLAAAAAARQVLSGRRLQYCMVAQAVSQLHAADGGPLYGLPYDALPPAVLEGQLGHLPHRLLLSVLGLTCAACFWDTCLSCDPPMSLHPLRPRHLLALCLRTARVALGSLGGEAAAEVLGPGRRQQQGEQRQGQQPQQQQREQGEQDGEQDRERQGGNAEPAACRSLGGRGCSRGSRAQAWLFGCGPAELRQLLPADQSLQLACDAMDLAMAVLPNSCNSGASSSSSGSSAGGGGVDAPAVARGGCVRPSAAAGCGGGGSDRTGRGQHLPGDGPSPGCPAQPDVPSGPSRPAPSAPHSSVGSGGGGAGGPPLLQHPAFAAEWWCLAMATVRAVLRHEQQQQGKKETWWRAYHCVELLQAGWGMAEEQEVDAGCRILKEPLAAALDAGYIPCAEAVLRHMYRAYNRSVPALLHGFCGSKRLLQQLLTHGDARQVAGLATALAKATLQLVQVVIGDGREEGGAAVVPGAGADATGAEAQGSGSSKCAAAARSGMPCLASWCLLQIVRQVDQGVVRCAEAARSGSGGGGDATFRRGSVEGAGPGAAHATRRGLQGPGEESEAAGAQGGGSCAPSPPRQGVRGEATLALASLALCRWLPLCAHIADMCRRQQQQQQEGEKQGEVEEQGEGEELEEERQGTADDPAGPLPAALRAGIALVLHACDATHEAGDVRALGSWRQLLYDTGSYMWVRDEEDRELWEAPWWDRGWTPGLVVGARAQGQQKAKRQKWGAGAEPGAGNEQQGGHAVSSVSNHTRARRGSTSGLQQQGADQKQVGLEEHQQQQENEQQGGKLQERYRVRWMPDGGHKLPYQLLPPPCDAGLLLPTCCHPLCTNLAGDSEAGVELRAWGGGGEGGGEGSDGSLYCSRECRTAHSRFRREQEAKELEWRVRRWGEGSEVHWQRRG